MTMLLTRPDAVAAQTVDAPVFEPTPTIDRVEALLAEVERISLYELDERDRNNISQECDRLGSILGLADPIAAAAEWPPETGNNRVMDRIDRAKARDCVDRMNREIRDAVLEDIAAWHAEVERLGVPESTVPMITASSDTVRDRLIAEDPVSAEAAFGEIVSIFESAVGPLDRITG